MAGPLEGVRVLELTHALAGPYCGMLLADLGAEVLKIEAPGEGDHVRQLGPPFVGGESIYFIAINRGKKSCTLNLKAPRGRDLLLALARDRDALLENFTPGTMARLGLDYETLHRVNPRLVYCSISGFGQTGPYRERGGFDTIAQAMSGIMSATGNPGQPPAKAGVPVLDMGTGTMAALAITSAVIARQRTGEGQYIDTSLMECGLAFSAWEAANYFGGAELPRPQGSAHRRNAPHQAFRTGDGWVAVAADRPHFWTALCRLLGLERLEGDPRFRTNADRLRHREELEALIETVTATRPTEHWVAELTALGIPCGPVLSYDQVCEDQHVKAREMVAEVTHPTAGSTRVIANPLKFAGTPLLRPRPAPLLGEHTVETLRSLGLADAEIAALRETGVV
jgi:crotonobetainyl-CoA:carnitine CoA-transferase CaiB-like acyl-CoA transferase